MNQYNFRTVFFAWTIILLSSVVLSPHSVFSQSTQLSGARFLIDSSGRLSPHELLTRPDLDWKPLTDETIQSRHYPNYIFFQVEAAPAGKERFLSTITPAESLILYDSSGIVLSRTGRNFWPGRMPLPGDYHTLPFLSGSGSYLIRSDVSLSGYKSARGKPLQPRLLIGREKYNTFLEEIRKLNIEHNVRRRLFVYALGIILLVILITHAVLLEKIYGRYLTYVLSIFLYYFFRRWGSFVEPDLYYPVWGYFAVEGFWTFLISLTYARFVLVYLANRPLRDGGWTRRLLRSAVSISIVGSVFCFLLLFLPDGLWWSNVVATYLRVLLVAFGGVIVVLLLRSRDQYARLMAGGILVLISGLALLIINELLRKYLNIDIEVPGFSFVQIGITGELVFYLLALLWRHREKKRQFAVQQVVLEEARSRANALEKKLKALRQPMLSIKLRDGSIRTWARTRVRGFTADGEVSRCLLENGHYEMVYIRLGQLGEQLADDFLRVHRSHIINVNAVHRLDRGRPTRVYLRGWEEPFPVSAGKVEELERRLR